MKLEEILLILQNRLVSLQENRKTAVVLGNLEQIAAIDNDLASTLTSIQQIKTIEEQTPQV